MSDAPSDVVDSSDILPDGLHLTPLIKVPKLGPLIPLFS
jgi:hypothetical protein